MHALRRRDFVKALGVGTTALALSDVVLGADDPAQRPNIVFILIDDLGWRDVGFMGSTYYETPNIDGLANEGVVFTNAYANGPNCAPTRACIMSGQYTPRHGVYTVGTPKRGDSRFRRLIPIKNRERIPAECVTLAEVLKGAGYATACIGKVHGHGTEGFDYCPSVKREKSDPKSVYAYTRSARTFIAQNKNGPFFLYLSHNAVHTPIEARADKVAKYRKKQGSQRQRNPEYAALIEHTDDSVGEIMDTLRTLGLTDKTVAIFFSDNGGHVTYTSMAPLRGSKGTMYEGGLRVPMIVSWPGHIIAGTECHTPVIGIDFYPTILELASVPRASGHVLDGESIVPLVRGTSSLNRQALFWHFPAYLEAYDRAKQGTWRSTPWGAVRRGNHKLIEFFEDGHLELYDLKNDIGEQCNLVEAMPNEAKQLHELLIEWRTSVNAPVPTKPNPEYDG